MSAISIVLEIFEAALDTFNVKNFLVCHEVGSLTGKSVSKAEANQACK
jgi:hypothetical protein